MSLSTAMQLYQRFKMATQQCNDYMITWVSCWLPPCWNVPCGGRKVGLECLPPCKMYTPAAIMLLLHYTHALANQQTLLLLLLHTLLHQHIIAHYNLDTDTWHTHTHTRLTALCPGLPGWAGTRKIKPIWVLLEQETISIHHSNYIYSKNI